MSNVITLPTRPDGAFTAADRADVSSWIARVPPGRIEVVRDAGGQFVHECDDGQQYVAIRDLAEWDEWDLWNRGAFTIEAPRGTRRTWTLVSCFDDTRTGFGTLNDALEAICLTGQTATSGPAAKAR